LGTPLDARGGVLEEECLSSYEFWPAE